MGKSCCAVGCKRRFCKNSELSFYRLPKNNLKREQWIAALGRTDWTPGKETWICGSHFVSGKKSDDFLHPDYVPSLFSFTSTAERTRAVNNLEKYVRSREVYVADESKEQAATALLNLHQIPASEPKVEVVEVPGIEVQTEETHSDIASLHQQIKSLNTECQSLREKVHKLESELKQRTLAPSQFHDRKLKCFTGLPNLQTFMLLFSYVYSVLPATTKQSLKPTQELLLTLMKLRTNLSEEFLGYLFGIHQSTVSRIFHRWIHDMSSRLHPIILWPEREDLRYRLIGMLRQKFTILSSTPPETLIRVEQNVSVEDSLIDKIVLTCCALCNLNETIVASDSNSESEFLNLDMISDD
ncbi:THAP domain-containing protein 1-like [Cololabis saira]|uniref:THAP domain-containing protein 1-like n=1 Tax=Cololabis saira TaxID=129043 RepID=UPI002AD1F7F0|nr:THAP domain-containing protein 1-like [Cololabis saira]